MLQPSGFQPGRIQKLILMGCLRVQGPTSKFPKKSSTLAVATDDGTNEDTFIVHI